MSLRVIAASASSILLITAAEFTRRISLRKAASISGAGLPDEDYEKYKRQINIFAIDRSQEKGRVALNGETGPRGPRDAKTIDIFEQRISP